MSLHAAIPAASTFTHPPQADKQLLFYPPSRVLQLATNQCGGPVPHIVARPGLYLNGYVTPAVRAALSPLFLAHSVLLTHGHGVAYSWMMLPLRWQ